MQKLDYFTVSESSIKNLCDRLPKESDNFIAAFPRGGYGIFHSGEIIIGILKENDNAVEYLSILNGDDDDEVPKIRTTRKISLYEAVLLLAGVKPELNQNSEMLVELLTSLTKSMLEKFKEWCQKTKSGSVITSEEALEFFR